jgi:multidrug resistance protein, MATE family
MGKTIEHERPARAAWAKEAAASLALSWPLILTNAAQTAMTSTDVLVMGRLGPEALAAGALGANLYFAFLLFGIGLVGATAPMIAEELGRRRHSVREVRRTVRQGLWTCLAVSVPMWAALWFAEDLLLMLGQDPALSTAAARYMHTMQWSILPVLMFIVLRSFLAALERPLAGLVVGAIAVVLNAVLNYILIFGHLGLPALGLPGSGLASTLANLAMLGILGVVLVRDRGFRRYHLFGRFWRADWPRFRALWRLGLPIGAALLFEVTIFNASALMMGLISPSALAAHAIAIQISSIAFMIPLGLGQAVTVRVGRAYGAGDRDGIALAGWTSYALGLAFAVATALVMIVVPRPMIGAFIDVAAPESTPVVELAVEFLAFAALFQIADGAQAVGSGMLRGLQDTRMAMIFCAVGYWAVGLPLGYVLAFPLGLGGAGVWSGLSTGLFVVAVMMLARWLRRDRFLRLAAAGPPRG